ncbi:MEDS domain-containing protein [Catelliglobosispora koreensis]|uniref:MEDS domain-containing protein n=1 Tax=Catelliglobosispora koreensis TaxID=129052 RepID=UPI00036FE4E5|nr:MEDS domain-containing protein [Catelliglobosispora koreensis]
MSGQEAIDRLELGDHVCWVFDDDQAVVEVTARYVAGGLSARQRVLYYTHAWLPEALIAGWEALGVPAGAALRSGQLQIRASAETYLDGGWFDAQATIETWPAHAEQAAADGWAGLRVAADMAWATRIGALDQPHADRLLWYEANVNKVFAQGKVVGVCLYDRRLFTAAELSSVASAHPATAIGHQENGWEPLMRMRYTDSPAGLRLSGAADVSNRDALAAMLERLPASVNDCGPYVVDVSQLSFTDAATAAMLAAVTSSYVRLDGVSPALHRLLDIVTPGGWQQAEVAS